ncbi:KH domain-containing protein [Aerococcaceae bacterium WGS1372]
MPDIKTLIKTIVEPLIDNPSDFSVDVVETEEFIEYRLNLHPEDIGRVIGRKGRVVRAIRTIIYGIRQRDSKRARVVIADDDN